MAILNVTANHDYRPDTVSNIDQIISKAFIPQR